MNMRSVILAAAIAASSETAMAQVYTPNPSTGIPNTGIGPAPTGVVPGGVVPVPAPSTTPAPNLTPPGPVAPLTPPTLTPPTGGIGVAPVPGFQGQLPGGRPTLNTFSEQQIRSNLMAQGYSGVSGLSVNGDGTWHGTAVRDGANVNVSIDSNGMVTPR